jgi:TniQ protein
MRSSRLPIPVPPARHETLASYLTRLAALHGLHPRELWGPVGSPQPGMTLRTVLVDRLAAVTGRPSAQLARALPELRDPPPDWTAWRHQPQPRCPRCDARCDARHDGGPVQRLLPQCTRHQYWIGPPDAGQPATPLDDPHLKDVASAQHRHTRLLRRHGAAVTFDAVLTGFLICGHIWADRLENWSAATNRWTHRSQTLIPVGLETDTFSAARIFAATYPETVDLAQLIAPPDWRKLAAGDADQQQRFLNELGRRLDRPDYQPPQNGDAIAHWMKYDSWRAPSRPHTTFPDTRQHRSGAPAKTSTQSLERHQRGAHWFAVNRRGDTVILHHRHIRPVLIRDWSPPMDGITATIWASQTTSHPVGNRFARP